MRHEQQHVCFIVPPHILKHMANSSNAEIREAAQHAMEVSAAARGRRTAIGPFAGLLAASPGVKRRTVYDEKGGSKLPGKLVRSEGGKASSDVSVNEAYDYAGDTYDFYSAVFARNSVDNKGMRLDSSVHYNRRFNNAFWDGTQMVYGDGDGVIFNRFTACIDVIGHELTHGVTQFTSALEYDSQSGALNEHFSDVMGSLVKQWTLKQTAAQADWLIGKGLFAPGVKGVALRSMKAPGTAYNDPKTLGRDPQPANMSHYVNTTQDNGGVHINSGIPNKAFYNVAITLGGNAWEKAGKIWYTAFTNKLGHTAQFADAANATYETAGELYGVGKTEQIAVGEGWKNVGINVSKQIIAGSAMITVKAPPASPSGSAAPESAYVPIPIKPQPREIEGMKISVQRSGGFANIGAHAEVDTSTLPREKADVLHRLIRGAAFPDQPAPPHHTAGAADVYQYDITVDDGTGAKTYRADELSMPEKWRAVVKHVLGQT